MCDSRLQSIHLEAAPRRDEFRRARSRVEDALGEHTMAGDLRIQDLANGRDRTFASLSESTPPNFTCWLLDRGRQLPLKIGLNSVGRLPDNDVVIDNSTVSRRHCAVVVHSDLTVELYDIASKNGTTINGRGLDGPTRLNDGDEIVLCERKLLFVKKSGVATIDPSALRQPRFSDERTLAE